MTDHEMLLSGDAAIECANRAEFDYVIKYLKVNFPNEKITKSIPDSYVKIGAKYPFRLAYYGDRFIICRENEGNGKKKIRFRIRDKKL